MPKVTCLKTNSKKFCLNFILHVKSIFFTTKFYHLAKSDGYDANFNDDDLETVRLYTDAYNEIEKEYKQMIKLPRDIAKFNPNYIINKYP